MPNMDSMARDSSTIEQNGADSVSWQTIAHTHIHCVHCLTCECVLQIFGTVTHMNYDIRLANRSGFINQSSQMWPTLRKGNASRTLNVISQLYHCFKHILNHIYHQLEILEKKKKMIHHTISQRLRQVSRPIMSKCSRRQ